MRSTLCSSALHCRICVIGMRTCFKHLKVMPWISSCGKMTLLVLLDLLTLAQKECTHELAFP